MAQVRKLLQSPYHEERLWALLILVTRFARTGPNQQEEIFSFYLKNKSYVNNWDLVDSSAPGILGAYLFAKDKQLLYDYARSNSLWTRRMAIIATQFFIQRDHFQDTLNLAELLLQDPEDLIHKACGWMLREVGKRDVMLEEQFLVRHYHRMPRTMLRYAIEKFDKNKRKRYLEGRW